MKILKPIKHLGNEVEKNIKILFRNWVSLTLIIIAPLILILLIGYSFSNDEVSGIIIGIIDENEASSPISLEGLESYSSIINFNEVDGCISELKKQKLHICILFKDIRSEHGEISDFSELSSGKITYYYDNSRKKISLLIIQNLQEVLGLESEKISIELTQSIIEKIQGLVIFVNENKNSFEQFKNESYAMQKDLEERRIRLEYVRQEFLKPYNQVKNLQSEVQNSTREIEDALSNIMNETKIAIALIKASSMAINETIDLNSINITNDDSDQDIIENFSTIAMDQLINQLDKQVTNLDNLTNKTVERVNASIESINQAVTKLDLIKEALDFEIESTIIYQNRINESVKKLDQLNTDLDQRLLNLKTLDPEMATLLVRPIVTDFEPILKEKMNIQLIFPLILVLIIMFISLLSSNIMALMEINSRAYQRNLIAPVNNMLYIFGLIITSVMIIFIQICVLFIVAQTRFQINISNAFWQLSLISLLLIIIFVILGMIFAYSIKSSQSSILVTTFVLLIFFLFSNTISTIESMPKLAQIISNSNPLVIGEIIFKQIQLFGVGIQGLMPEILSLFIFIIILLSILIFSANRRYKGGR
ncbi:MAG: ABC transporter permease [Candidatus Woesearchaeota archaeon]